MIEPKKVTQPARERHYFGMRPVDPAMTRFLAGVALVLVLALAMALKPLLGEPSRIDLDGERVRFVEAEDAASLVKHLRHLGLWEIGEREQLPAVVFSSFPPDIGKLRVENRKRVFLHTLAPTAMVALAEVERERAELLRIIGRMDLRECSLEQLLNGEFDHRQCGISRADADFLEELSSKYRSKQLDLLLKRVSPLPLSLILAQAAMESSWGASRFSLEGNNIFGIWTWSGHGMVPADRSDGLNHRVAIYDSLLDSVRSYLLMLNRVAAYRTLREIRQESMDSLALINGLRYYSEKRDEYVDDLRLLILANRLQRYDNLSLLPFTPGAVEPLSISGEGQVLTRVEP